MIYLTPAQGSYPAMSKHKAKKFVSIEVSEVFFSSRICCDNLRLNDRLLAEHSFTDDAGSLTADSTEHISGHHLVLCNAPNLCRSEITI